jgi:cellulose synthase/poly-beta-1,6-N-acetylglucosamine synthase-like glycosyltransferase
VTVCIPTVPQRYKQLARAVGSAVRQNRPPEALSISMDREFEGAWVNRTRAVQAAQTEWVALLDDDDWLHPHHLSILMGAVEDDPTIDYAFTWFDVHGGTDPLGHFGKVWDPEHPTQTTTTVLVRKALAEAAGYWQPPPGGVGPDQLYAGEDFAWTLRCRDAGGRIVHIPEITWTYVHSQEPGVGNFSGLPNRARAGAELLGIA